MAKKQPQPNPTLQERAKSNVDFILYLKPKKENSHAQRIGVGFKNEWGGINLVLNTGVVLSWRDCNDHWLNLWPNDRDEEVPF